MKSTIYESITHFFLDNWLIAPIILVIVIIAFLPRLRDGVKLLREWYNKIFPKTQIPHYTPCSQWMISAGDRVRNIDDNLYRQNGILTVLNIKGNYAVCYIGDPFNHKINTFNINELTSDGIY